MSPQRGTSEARKTRDKQSLEARRARGEISCAECRRLKLKCDKIIPCSSCVRRGCQTVCPNGTLSTGQGSRGVLADTDKLHLKLAEMSKRIRQLEDALQIAHAAVSSVQHPLLSEDLLQIKSGVAKPLSDKEDNDDADREIRNDNLDSEILGSFGALAVSHRQGGAQSYLTDADVLLVTPFDPEEPLERKMLQDETNWPSTLPVQVTHLSRAFPFAPLYLPVDEIQNIIEEMLPPYERASALVEAYLENLSWFFRPVDREQIMEELIPTVYKRRHTFKSASASASSPSTGSAVSNASSPAAEGSPCSDEGAHAADAPESPHTDAHTLALLFAVFAVGAVADLTLAPCNDEAELYIHLARAAVSLKSVFDGASLQSVQAVALLGAYDLFSCRKRSLSGTWKMISFGMSLASSIGLQRDPGRWKLSPKMTQRRRQVFWELYTFDVWKGFGSGRPPTFYPSVVDCELPYDSDATIGEDGTEIPSIFHWRYRFVKEVVTEVVHKLSMARALKYSEILELDQKICDFGPQQLFNRSAGALSTSSCNEGVKSYLGRYMLNLLKDITHILLHRNFFARAILDEPMNPMRSAFGPSFLSAYRSATTMLHIVRENFDGIAHLMLRMWPVWAHALTASVILGSVAALGGSSALAPQAFLDFDLAIALFAKAQMHPVVKSGLPILLRLRDKARLSIIEQRSEIVANPNYRHQNGFLVPGTGGLSEKEFSVVGGLGRLLRKSFEGEFGYSPKPPSEVLGGSLTSSAIPGPSALGKPQKAASAMAPHCCADMSVFSSMSAYTSSSGTESRAGRCAQTQYVCPNASGNSADTDTRGCSDDAAHAAQASTSTTGSGMTMPSPAPSDAPHSHQPVQTQTGANALGYMSDFNAHDAEFSALMDVSHDPSMNVSFWGAHDGSMLDAGMSHFLYGTGFSNSPFSGADDASVASSSDTKPGFNIYMQGQKQTTTSSTSPSGAFLNPDGVQLSPPMAFSSDFEVSYDLRSATGEGSLLPLIPQDMEAWRAILQDSRFFNSAGNGDPM